jgi:hypothetical protein
MTSPHRPNAPAPGDAAPRRVVRAVIWLPGLTVALGAAATAHGLFQVALAARVPVVIAWLYPLITDGLALVASAATGSSGLSRWPYRVESMRKPPPGVQLYPCGVATATPQHVTVASHANIRMPAREFVVPAPRRNE